MQARGHSSLTRGIIRERGLYKGTLNKYLSDVRVKTAL